MMAEQRRHEVMAALDAALDQHSELREFLRFYREIYEAQFNLRASLPPAHCGLDAQHADSQLDRGERLMDFADLGLTPGQFAAAVEVMGRVVERHNPEWAGVCDLFPVEELLGDEWTLIPVSAATAVLGPQRSWPGRFALLNDRDAGADPLHPTPCPSLSAFGERRPLAARLLSHLRQLAASVVPGA